MGIIAISGKIGSGKTTVSQIINNFIKGKNYIENIGWVQKRKYTDGYEIKNFTDKLKQIVSILTGISVEDLEKQEVKDRVLGEEWWYHKHFAERKPYSKELVRLWGKESVFKPTVRQLLQEIGTEAMRNVIHPNIWVNALFADYKIKYINQAKGKEVCVGNYEYYINGLDSKAEIVIKQNPNWIITDLRELEAIKSRGGITIRVNRTYTGDNVVKKTNNGDGSITLSPADPNWGKIILKEHPSETALNNAEFDYVIDNDGTIEELIEKVKEILIKEKLL